MRTVDSSIGLYVRNGVFYFRKVIPKLVEHAFAGKRELVRSLKTGDRSDAERLARQYHVDFDRQCARAGLAYPQLNVAAVSVSATCCNFSESEAERLAIESVSVFEQRFATGLWEGNPQNRQDLQYKRGLVEQMIVRAQDALVLNDYAAVDEYVEALIEKNGFELAQSSHERLVLRNQIFRARLEALKIHSSRLEGNVGAGPFDPLFARGRVPFSTRNTQSISLAELIEKFVQTHTPAWAPKTRMKYVGLFGVVKRYFGASRPVASILRTDCRAFVDDVLGKLPPNWQKSAKIKKRSLVEVAGAAEKNGVAPINAKTQREYLRVLHGLFTWAMDETFIEVVPTSGLKIIMPKGYKSAKVRGPFAGDQLRVIFGAPLYVGCRNDQAGYSKIGDLRPRKARFWVPLLALFTGMRLNEITSLRTSDVSKKGEVWLINVQEDLAEGKTLKNTSSARIIPVHAELLRIGFDRFVGECAKNGKTHLFGEIVATGGRRPSDNFSQWFGRFLKSVNVKTTKLNFHSFRHTFRDGLREAGLPVEVVKALGGWANSEVHEGYGKGYEVATLQAAIDKVEYRELDLTHLYP